MPVTCISGFWVPHDVLWQLSTKHQFQQKIPIVTSPELLLQGDSFLLQPDNKRSCVIHVYIYIYMLSFLSPFSSGNILFKQCISKKSVLTAPHLVARVNNSLTAIVCPTRCKKVTAWKVSISENYKGFNPSDKKVFN